MAKEKIHISIVVLFCLFVCPVMFQFSSFCSYAYIYGIPLMYLLLNRKLLKLSKRQRKIISAAVFLIILGYIYPTLHRTYDYSYIRVTFFIFRKLIIYLFLACVIVKKHKEKASFEYFIYYYAITHAIYVIGTLLLVFIPELKNFWFHIFVYQSGTENMQKSYGYTFRIGWQGFSGYRLTLHCTFCCIFLLYLYFIGGKTFHINIKQFLPTYLLCILGNMFYGRSGLILSLLTSFIALVVWSRKHFFSSIIFVVILGLAVCVIYFMREIPIISDWYNWMSSPIINLFKRGSFDNASFNNLNNMVFMPEWKTILFGDGYYTFDGHYYMKTDSGIMRNILFWGIIGMAVSYGVTIYTLMDLEKKHWLLCLLMLFTFAISEYKGDVYYEFVALLLSASFVESIRDKKYAGRVQILNKGYVWGIM